MSEDIGHPQAFSGEGAPAFIMEGTVDNGAILPVVFSFYSGPADVRNRGNGHVEFAFFRPTPLRPWRQSMAEGTIGSDRYRAITSKISNITKAMIVVTAQKI